MSRFKLISKRCYIAIITMLITFMLMLFAASLSVSVLHPSTGQSVTQLSSWLTQHKIYFIFWHIIFGIAIITGCSFKLKQLIKKHSLTPKQATQLKLFYGLLVGVIGMMILITFG